MKTLFAVLYQRFAFGAFASGIIGGVGSGLVIGSDVLQIIGGIFYILSSALLAWLHGILAELDSHAASASAASGGIIEADTLLNEELRVQRARILTFAGLAVLAFVLGVVSTNRLVTPLLRFG